MNISVLPKLRSVNSINSPFPTIRNYTRIIPELLLFCSQRLRLSGGIQSRPTKSLSVVYQCLSVLEGALFAHYLCFILFYPRLSAVKFLLPGYCLSKFTFSPNVSAPIPAPPPAFRSSSHS